jgi:Na+-translocating ferredoxin:NAD+ oxidoreductase RNF subunit RnfB
MGDPDIKAATKEDVITLTEEAAQLGLVHATDNDATNCAILCACCECCCGMLKGITRFDNPRAIAKANYISLIDEEKCTGCETCLERCKFNAITVNDIAHIDRDKCLGCGLCAVTCPSDAITMVRFERENIPGTFS